MSVTKIAEAPHEAGINFAYGREELRAFFDLKVHPVTFDIGSYLAMAEAARVRAGCSHIRFFVVPGPGTGFRNSSIDHSTDHS